MRAHWGFAASTFFLAATCFAQSAPKPAHSVRELAWLAGCWAYEGAESGSGETWMPAAGGSLLGIARHIEGGKLASWELQRIVEQADGRLVFIAAPSGQPETTFALKSLTAYEAVFENPDNPFPKRVIYRLAQNGNISARIQGADDDPERARDFPMKRTSCEKAETR